MKCNECDIEFTPTRLNVEGQKYCSIKCRNSSAQKRRYEKIAQEYQNSKENSISNNIGGNNRENREIEFTAKPNYYRESNDNNIENSNNDFNARVGLIETNFNTKSELILCRIQLDYANREIEELKKQIKDLEIELFTFENEELEVNPQMEVVNNLIKGFSTDPVGVLNFAKEMFKSKIA